MSLGVMVEGLSKTFKGRAVLKGITCGFPEGRVNAILGPNGSGKTTLLRIIARLVPPDAGEVGFFEGGKPQQDGLDLMRRMTLVSQDPVLFNTTLFKNIAFGLKLRGLPSGEIKSRVDEALDVAGISRLAGEAARTLSGGEAQRAALARAYALRPELLLLDEPSANLDPEGIALMESLVRVMRDGFGTTVVMVTHNLFQARRLADKAFLLYGGELVESGAKEDFFGNPQKELTREFLSGEVIF